MTEPAEPCVMVLVVREEAWRGWEGIPLAGPRARVRARRTRATVCWAELLEGEGTTSLTISCPFRPPHDIAHPLPAAGRREDTLSLSPSHAVPPAS